MTKNQYLTELEKQLKANGVNDIDEIVSEYEQHFIFKLNEGLTEEEIAKKLSSPKEIAKEYSNAEETDNCGKNVKRTGLIVASIPLFLLSVVAWAFVAVLGAFSIASVVTGFCLIAGINLNGLIPYVPYFPAFTIGLSLLALSVLSTLSTILTFFYVKRSCIRYIKKCKNPSQNIRFEPSNKFTSKLKLTALIALACFLVTFAIGYISTCILSGSMEPWHVWKWFQ